ncbi:MAG: acyl-CoA dehydrogenase [Gammaproteobacteria bacterium]|nr:MAG: acyl-CoA dehydrogenase [Gammaproteobacteria bacterium]
MDTRQMLLDTAEKMFADHCDKALLDQAEQGQFPDSLLGLIREGGFQQLAMPSSGVDLADALAVLRVAGLYALPLPLAEMLLANRWLGNDERLVSIGSGDKSGADNVPWGRAMDAVIALSPNGEAHLLTELSVEEGVNLAGEPRDSVRAGAAEPLSIEEDAGNLLALTRAILMAGGLERALALSLDYVSEREQFGRPISKFQAIQHHMAVMAAETAASIRAADAGLAALGSDRQLEEVAAAKARIGEAVGVVAELAHQVHGAMGYTHEHQLHHTTRRLWAWRDEYGTEQIWQQQLGSALARRVAEAGGDALWDFIASRG